MRDPNELTHAEWAQERQNVRDRALRNASYLTGWYRSQAERRNNPEVTACVDDCDDVLGDRGTDDQTKLLSLAELVGRYTVIAGDRGDHALAELCGELRRVVHAAPTVNGFEAGDRSSGESPVREDDSIGRQENIGIRTGEPTTYPLEAYVWCWKCGTRREYDNRYMHRGDNPVLKHRRCSVCHDVLLPYPRPEDGDTPAASRGDQ